jgi:drug/metabolite transporter (DMT)-like permease
VFAFTWGSRATVKHFPDLTPIGRTTITLTGAAFVSAIMALGVVALGGSAANFNALGLPELMAFALYSIGSLALAQVLWIMAVGKLGIGVASFHMNATPFYVMLFLVALGGSWSNTQALGAVIVAAGVMIAQYRTAR